MGETAGGNGLATMRPRRRSDVVDRSADTEHLVLDRRNGQLHRLNATAAMVWSACDGEHSIEEIAALLRASFEDAPEHLEADVAQALHQLRTKGLLE